MRVEVRNNNIEKALRTLKRKMVEEGIFKDMQKKRFYEKPSDKRRRLKRAGIARVKRELTAQRQSEE